MSATRNAQPKKTPNNRRPRFLILSYDSKPNQELLWPLADRLAEHADVLFLVQFPETLRKLRKRGFHARSIRSVLGWEHGGSYVRKHGLPAPLIELSDTIEYECRAFPDVPKQNLMDHANAITHRFKDLIDSWDPSFILAWNGHTLPYKPCLTYARHRGIALRVLERGFFPGSLFLDTDGTNSASAVKKHFQNPIVGSEEKAHELVQRLTAHYAPIARQNTASLSKGESLRTRLGFEENTFLFLIPEQLENDSNTVLFCKEVKSNREVLAKVSEAIDALGYTNVRVLYKTHPELNSKQDGLSGHTSSHVQVVSDISIEQLLRECDALITRNSTLGFEGLLFGKRCITFGSSIYSGLGMTDDVDSTSKLSEVVARVYHSAQLPEGHQLKLVQLVSLLHESHHYFVEPANDEESINHTLVDNILREARTRAAEGTAAHDDWTSLPWKVRMDEFIWDLRLRYRGIKQISVSGLGAP